MFANLSQQSERKRKQGHRQRLENTKEAERLCPTQHWLWNLQVPKATDRGKSQALVIGRRVNQDIMGSYCPPGTLHESPRKASPSESPGGCLSLLILALGGTGGVIPFENPVPSLSPCRVGARNAQAACAEAGHMTASVLWTSSRPPLIATAYKIHCG